MLALGACLAGLLWYSRRREKKINRLEVLLPKADTERGAEQEMLLELLWKHKGIGSAGLAARYLPKVLDQKLAEHHLKLLKEEGLVGVDALGGWYLKLSGEKYVIKGDLHNDRGQYFDN